MVVGLDAPGRAQQLAGQLLVQPSLLGDDPVHDARLIALRPRHAHLGRGRTDAVTAHVQRRRLLVADEERVEPEVEHLLLITRSQTPSCDALPL